MSDEQSIRALESGSQKLRRARAWIRAYVWFVTGVDLAFLAVRVYEHAGWFKIVSSSVQLAVAVMILWLVYKLERRTYS